jgi:hypothetical protein
MRTVSAERGNNVRFNVAYFNTPLDKQPLLDSSSDKSRNGGTDDIVSENSGGIDDHAQKYCWSIHTWISITFYTNFAAMAIHLVMFFVVLGFHNIPNISTHVTYNVWTNMTGVNVTDMNAMDMSTANVPEMCSAQNNDTKSLFMEFELYPVITDSGWSVNIKTYAYLWFLMSFLFPAVEFWWVCTRYKSTFHQTTSEKLTKFDKFKHWLEDCPVFYFRYLEHTISASMMIVALYVLVGIRDQNILIFVGISNAVCMLLGLLADKLRFVEYQCKFRDTYMSVKRFLDHYNFSSFKWRCHWMGWVHVLTYWLVLLIYLSVGTSGWLCSEFSESVPSFITVVFGSCAMIFALFGFVQLAAFYQFDHAESHLTLLWVSVRTLLSLTLLSAIGKTVMGVILIVNVLVT